MIKPEDSQPSEDIPGRGLLGVTSNDSRQHGRPVNFAVNALRRALLEIALPDDDHASMVSNAYVYPMGKTSKFVRRGRKDLRGLYH